MGHSEVMLIWHTLVYAVVGYPGFSNPGVGFDSIHLEWFWGPKALAPGGLSLTSDKASHCLQFCPFISFEGPIFHGTCPACFHSVQICIFVCRGK